MVSAFFIDTEQRQDKSDYNNPGNVMRKGAKTVVLGEYTIITSSLSIFLHHLSPAFVHLHQFYTTTYYDC